MLPPLLGLLGKAYCPTAYPEQNTINIWGHNPRNVNEKSPQAYQPGRQPRLSVESRGSALIRDWRPGIVGFASVEDTQIGFRLN